MKNTLRKKNRLLATPVLIGTCMVGALMMGLYLLNMHAHIPMTYGMGPYIQAPLSGEVCIPLIP